MEWIQVLTIMLTSTITSFVTIFTVYREIQREMKDFHGRLCQLEERNSKRGK